jgi:hypothetical protein
VTVSSGVNVQNIVKFPTVSKTLDDVRTSPELLFMKKANVPGTVGETVVVEMNLESVSFKTTLMMFGKVTLVVAIYIIIIYYIFTDIIK